MPERPAIEDIPVNMVREHLRDIPQAAFPAGFGIRAMRADEGPVWTAVQRDAEPFFAIEDGLFATEFGDDPALIEQRCFLVVTDADEAVGTSSAWFSEDFKGRDHGRIHWVAVRPAYQGRGLAKAALTYAMNRMAEWHERAWLATSTGRLPALRMYLQYGFVPDLDPPNALDAWRKVAAHIDHPALPGR